MIIYVENLQESTKNLISDSKKVTRYKINVHKSTAKKRKAQGNKRQQGLEIGSMPQPPKLFK